MQQPELAGLVGQNGKPLFSTPHPHTATTKTTGRAGGYSSGLHFNSAMTA